MLVIIGFICILLLVIAHEAGHFFAARRNGIEVEEFGVGFPPRAKVLGKKNGTTYTLNWLPLGGFVKLKGEHDSDTVPGSFGAARLRDKVKVMVAGVVVNFLIAYLLFSIIALIGIPRLVDDQFTVPNDTKIIRQDVLAGYVDPESPADKANGLNMTKAQGVEGGLQANDTILSIAALDCPNPPEGRWPDCEGTRLIETSDDLSAATESLEGMQVRVLVNRGGEEIQFQTQLLSAAEVEASKETDTPKGHLGVVPSDFVVQRSSWSAPLVGAGVTLQFTELTLKGLGSIVAGLFQGDASEAAQQVSGVVGVGYVFDSASFLGPVFMLMIVAVISLSLAIMNTLPIPALDGGRLFVTLLYRLRRKKLTKETEEKIHGTGFALLMMLFILITILDVQRFIL